MARGVTNEKIMSVQSAVTNLALLLKPGKTTGVCVCVCSACVFCFGALIKADTTGAHVMLWGQAALKQLEASFIDSLSWSLSAFTYLSFSLCSLVNLLSAAIASLRKGNRPPHRRNGIKRNRKTKGQHGVRLRLGPKPGVLLHCLLNSEI